MGRATLATRVMSSSKFKHEQVEASIPRIFRKTHRKTWWNTTCNICTLFIPNFVLSFFKMKDKNEREAWREKFTLCSLIVISCCALAFVTYGMNMFVCRDAALQNYGTMSKQKVPMVVAFGRVFIIGTNHPRYDELAGMHMRNVSPMLRRKFSVCETRFGGRITTNTEDFALKETDDLADAGELYYSWYDIQKLGLTVINGLVVDGRAVTEEFFEPFFKKNKGRDASQDAKEWDSEARDCLLEEARVGKVLTKSVGCVLSDIVLYASTVSIFGLIIVRFALATFYYWRARAQMRSLRRQRQRAMPCVLLVTAYSEDEKGLRATLNSLARQEGGSTSRVAVIVADGAVRGSSSNETTPDVLRRMIDPLPGYPRPSADYVALAAGDRRHNRASVIAGIYTPSDEPCLGHRGNNVSSTGVTGNGALITSNLANRHGGLMNSGSVSGITARSSTIYNGTGVVNVLQRPTLPVLLILKEGAPGEKGARAGNRGKRDSQVLLMGFFQRLAFNDLFVPVDTEIYRALCLLQPNVDPAAYEAMLMVDADTVVAHDAVSQMLALLDGDTNVVGLCGETRIVNKGASWVTAIQVFEYYISHHLAKSFESVFGGVTCIPGCFGMYRLQELKHVRGEVFSLPVLSHPLILNAYSSIETRTLHQKNLLLLGEDRYLTTLLLKNFFHRKLVFCPTAHCYTEVPARFSVLLSQRRRWINSTVHNYFELAMVDQLCGTFCCSMKFVVLMELGGTLVLPAAIVFTGVLIFRAVIGEPAWIPLIMLFGILGLPAFLVGLTTFDLTQVFWLIIYIISLPIWNFVLPTHAFWHFDDFTWGETRKVYGEDGKDHGDTEGKYDLKECKVGLLSDLLKKEPL